MSAEIRESNSGQDLVGDPDDIRKIEKLFDHSEINLKTAVEGFITLMKMKTSIPLEIVSAFDTYVSDLEEGFKTIFGLQYVDYDLTDNSSSSEPDSPPPVKKFRKELSGAKQERYIEALRKKISKFLFYSDQEKRTMFPDNLTKKICLRRFLMESELKKSEMEKFISSA